MGLQNSPRELPVTTWLRNWFLALGAEQILVISPEIRRHLRRVGAPDQALVDFNFVGLDIDAFQPSPDDYLSVRSEFGFPSDALIVSTIGALHPRKSHELFVEAAVTVSNAEPRARFLGIGAFRTDSSREQPCACGQRACAARVDSQLGAKSDAGWPFKL